MLGGQYSAILLTFIKLSFVIKSLVLSIIEWLFYTGFIVLYMSLLVLITKATDQGSNEHAQLYHPAIALLLAYQIITERHKSTIRSVVQLESCT